VKLLIGAPPLAYVLPCANPGDRSLYSVFRQGVCSILSGSLAVRSSFRTQIRRDGKPEKHFMYFLALQHKFL
jgi:hypothetical protein